MILGLTKSFLDPHDTQPCPNAFFSLTDLTVSGRDLNISFLLLVYRDQAAYSQNKEPIGQVGVNITGAAAYAGVIGNTLIPEGTPAGTPLFYLVRDALYQYALANVPDLASATPLTE